MSRNNQKNQCDPRNQQNPLTPRQLQNLRNQQIPFDARAPAPQYGMRSTGPPNAQQIPRTNPLCKKVDVQEMMKVQLYSQGKGDDQDSVRKPTLIDFPDDYVNPITGEAV